jgi:alanyl-tRNA synthetase
MQTDELREKYLAFFESQGCVRRPSDVLVPRWDPSVLFTPAGMNQFKDHFLGRCKLEFTRATTCQKCLRTGDIDNVGRTPYHHTFFEMLGNFSFGDYFKREAIHWAWEFLTGKTWLGVAPDLLSATIYLDDEEAAAIWLDEIHLPPERLQRLGEDENYWPANAPTQGPDGVCGPSSEIYVRTHFGQVEVWNLVFTQFNRVGPPPGNLRPLPKKNIDTGMGLERMASVLQGVETNFHIDILRPLVEAAGEVCQHRYAPEAADPQGTAARLRRIADHVRACTFAIHENVVPGNKKQGYVIRRLLRRAVLDGRQISRREPFLYQLVPLVADLTKRPYPELGASVPRIQRIIREEEENFLATIDAGLSRIERIFDAMKNERRGVVSGGEAADMYQTHGFPPELFENLAAERNLAFDWQGFREEMERHGLESGAGEKIVFKTGPIEALKKAVHETRFLGYETLEVADARVVGLVAGQRLCDAVTEDDQQEAILVVLDRTPFYGEMGGQVGDAGELVGDGFRFQVTDAQIDGALVLHRGHLREGRIELGQQAVARVNPERRQAVRRAHTGTHLLHYALRKVLGEHAVQQGSKVGEDSFRFDFASPSATSPEDLLRIEDEVNRRIWEGQPVRSAHMPLAEARQSGAMMLFSEKYPDVVRMISIGEFSKELCGGTHLDNTGQVGLLRITGEESVAAGTRRITAVTGRAALDHARRTQAALARTAALLRTAAEDVPERVEILTKEIRQLRKQLAAGPKGEAASSEQLAAAASEVAGVRIVVVEIPGGTPQSLRDLVDQLRRKAAPVAALLGARQDEGKVMLVAGLSRDLVERGLDAVQWIRSAAAVVGGGGGGRPDLAQAGGKIPDKLPEALEAGRVEIARRLAG